MVIGKVDGFSNSGCIQLHSTYYANLLYFYQQEAPEVNLANNFIRIDRV